MKILEFTPGQFRCLLPQPIYFSEENDDSSIEKCSIRFLVGRNGVGKTNLLRFLTSIFIALNENFSNPHADSPAYNIPFQLTYELNEKIITIISKGQGKSGIQFKFNNEKESRDWGDIPDRDRILPKGIMVYSSGDLLDWRAIFTQHTLQDKRKSENNEIYNENELRIEEEESPKSLRIIFTDSEFPENESAEPEYEPPNKSQYNTDRIFLIEPAHLQLALLVALLDFQYRNPNQSALDDVIYEIPIHLLSFSFYVNLYDTAIDDDISISPFQRRLLNQLFDMADLKLKSWEEQQWVYDLDQIKTTHEGTTLENLMERLVEDPFQFFRALASLLDNGVINSINLVIEYKQSKKSDNKGKVLLAEYLSDGEFSYLSRMALIYLLNEKECLFLLDEPEIHFNDDWKRNLVDSIERALTGTNSEIILTSHASIVLTDAYPDEIILLKSYGQEENIPLTFAAEQGEVLRMIFDSERSVGKRAMRHVQQVIDNGSEEDLKKLLDDVGPGHYRFKIVKELQKHVSSD